MYKKRNGERKTLLKIISELKKNSKDELADELTQLITCGKVKPKVSKSKNFGVLKFKVH